MTDFKDRLELLKNWDKFEAILVELSQTKQKLEDTGLELLALRLQRRADIEKLEDQITEIKDDPRYEKEWFAQQMFEEYDGKELTEKVEILNDQKDEMRKRIKFLTSSNVIRWEFLGIAIIVKRKK